MNDSYKYDPTYHRFCDFLGINKLGREDIRVASKIAHLYDWASSRANSDDFSKVAQTVDSVIQQQGVSFVGKTLIDYLYQRVRIKDDSSRMRDEEEAKKRKIQESQKEIRKIKSDAQKFRRDQNKIKKNTEKISLEADERNNSYIKEYEKSQKSDKRTIIKGVETPGSSPESVSV